MGSTTNSKESGSKGFVLQAQPSVMLDVADVLGRVGKRALHSVNLGFGEVFNCLSTLRHVANSDRYIANEGADSGVRVTSWDNARLAGFMDLIAQDKVEGLSANQREKESLRTLSLSLSGTNEYRHN